MGFNGGSHVKLYVDPSTCTSTVQFKLSANGSLAVRACATAHGMFIGELSFLGRAQPPPVPFSVHAQTFVKQAIV